MVVGYSRGATRMFRMAGISIRSGETFPYSIMAIVVPVVLLALMWPAGALAGQCANEQLRTEQGSTSLPECRAWELVSPPEKHGNNVSITRATDIAAPTGNAFVFGSSGAFADAPTSLGLGYYLSTRGPEGWSTRSVEAPQENAGFLIVQGTLAFSPDLTQAFQVSRKALAPGAVEGQGNAYLTNMLTGRRTLLASSSDEGLFFNQFGYGSLTNEIQATPDYSHVAFATAAKLTPDAVEGQQNVYEWGEGDLRLASLLPGGAPAAEGASDDAVFAGTSGAGRVLFTAEDEGSDGLYMRDGETTVALSASQRVPHSPLEEGEVPRGTVAEARYGGASADGSAVYFTSSVPLTNTTSSSYEERLYRYEVASGKLTALSGNAAPGATPEQVTVLQVSRDDKIAGDDFVYFTADGALAPGATQAGFEFRNTNLYVWHGSPGEQGTIHFIAQTSCQVGEANGQPLESCPENIAPQEWDASPSGEHFAFAAFSQLTSYENKSQSRCPADAAVNSVPGACTAVYEYNYLGHLSCLSCNPTGAPPAGPSSLDGGYGGGTPQLAHDFTNNVLDDGRVFFDSPDDLSSAAVNAHQDVYESREDGSISLISSATAGEDAYFADATPDGSNVFFKTSAALVAEDTDSAYDVYDAREDGGIASQNERTSTGSECQGDECQGPSTSPPTLSSSATTQVPQGEGAAAAKAASFSIAALSGVQRARLARTGKISVSVKVSGAGVVSLLATERVDAHKQVLASGSRDAARAGTVAVTLVLSRAARLRLARQRKLRLAVSVRFSAASASKQLTFVLERPVRGR
jgi:hypothetical protein